MEMVVIGAGAIGSFVAAGLARNGGSVTLVARGSRLEWLRDNPVEIESAGSTEHIRVAAASWAELTRPANLAIICTKTPELPDVLRDLAAHLAPSAVVVTLQNGVEAPYAAAEALPDAAIVAGRFHGFFDMIGQRVRHVGVPSSINFGCIGGPAQQAERLVAGALEAAGIAHAISPDIVTALWEKFMLASSIGGLSVAWGVNAGQVTGIPDGESMLRAAMHEVATLARTFGAKLGGADVEQTLDFVRSFPESVTTSLQRDIEAGRPSEYDAVVGAVIRLAGTKHLPVPAFAEIDRLARSRYPAI